MILRPVQLPAATSRGHVPAWPAVERVQRETYDRCWMITQPSHAALSGEIAAALAAPGFPNLDRGLVRAIALHDAGWGPTDAQAITRSRAAKPVAPRSFLAMEVVETLEAWSQSIQIAQSVGPAGGYIVSRHFHRIAERRIADGEDSAADRKKLEQFLAHETQRQRGLAAKQELSAEELEAFTDVLQLCDLLSLYFCCGAREYVEFPECCGVKLRTRPEKEGFQFDPPVLEAGTLFTIAALLFPRSEEKSSEEIRITIL